MEVAGSLLLGQVRIAEAKIVWSLWCITLFFNLRGDLLLSVEIPDRSGSKSVSYD